MKLPETPSIVDLGRKKDAAATGAVSEAKSAMSYHKQNVTNTEAILVMLGGAAIQMRVEQSISGPVEEGGLMQFAISIMDVDSGAVVAENIDITSISAVIEKSTGGAAFSDAGLDAIVFGKETGRVFKDYTFNAAQWTVGDVYKIVVSGIEATIGTDTAYVPAMVWSNFVVEDADLATAVADNQTDLNSILADIGDFSARAQNLKSLLAVLGVPDVDNDTLYKLIYTDMLAHGTHGLAALDADLTTIINDLANGTDGLGALLTAIGLVPGGTPGAALASVWTAGLATSLGTSNTSIASAVHGLAALKALVDTMQGNVTDILADTGTAGVVLGTKVAAFKTLAGEMQMAEATLDLNQVAADYDLFTGTAEDCWLIGFSIKMPDDLCDDATLTSISVHTDDSTPAVLVDPTLDAIVVNLTAEAEFSWSGKCRINVGTKIQLTIAGGAEGAEYIVTATAEYRAINDTGYLA